MVRGSLRVYLGAAPGVGKTYAMLNEGWRRHDRGTDVIVGWVNTHQRQETADQIRDLEVISPISRDCNGTPVQEMDLEAIIARRPAVALVDELAHNNAPGSLNQKRWQDIEDLLAVGISVISTLNVEQLESLSSVASAITGVFQQETVPDSFVRSTEQVELVDMTPEALRRRLAHGHIFPPEKVDIALANYFRAGNLAALRELALLWVADDVENRLQEYRQRHGIDEPWELRERVLVALTGGPNGEHLIRRAARMARRAKGDLTAVHVRSNEGEVQGDSSDLERQRALVVELGGVYKEVLGADVASSLVQFARSENATQIVLGASQQSRWARLRNGSIINSIITNSGESIDVHVISPPLHVMAADGNEIKSSLRDQSSSPNSKRRLKWRKLSAISRRRRILGLLTAAMTLPLLTFLISSSGVQNNLTLGTIALLYLLPVVASSAIGGAVPGVSAALAGFLLLNWYFTPPIHTFAIANPGNILALLIFLLTAAVVSIQVDLVARRSLEAKNVRAQAAALARTSTAILNNSDPIPRLIEEISRTFRIDGISLIRATSNGWKIEETQGSHPPLSPIESTLAVPVSSDQMLALNALHLGKEDLGSLNAFIDQVGVAIVNRELQARASETVALGKANDMRTALLAAVSHDLRTPLASIKAAVTSLLPADLTWESFEVRTLLETIDSETDRLHSLVANLLDMSRIQTGALVIHLEPVGLDEIVSSALISLPPADHKIVIDVSENLPHIEADGPLLERAIANLISNARAASNCDTPIRIAAASNSEELIELRIIDRGPGIAPEDRERVFIPFQRLGDQDLGNGVGLGMAVAKGFLEAMGGDIALDDTPGGGATVILHLKTAPSLNKIG